MFENHTRTISRGNPLRKRSGHARPPAADGVPIYFFQKLCCPRDQRVIIIISEKDTGHNVYYENGINDKAESEEGREKRISYVSLHCLPRSFHPQLAHYIFCTITNIGNCTRLFKWNSILRKTKIQPKPIRLLISWLIRVGDS